ncbi:cytochrome P450 [Amylostereum chailletii]|nr:cytochrome P450 [Amylostereum chailletii]
MQEVIAMARDAVVAGKDVGDAALLRALVEANMNQDGDAKRLTDDELLSNIFVFFLAGHETSAHALSFTFILLALYPDVQQKVYEEALQLWPDGKTSDSSYKIDMPQLEYTLATFRETIRLYPAEARLAKLVNQDTTIAVALFTPHKDGANHHGDVRKQPILLPRGSVVLADILGVHRNPLHWGSDCKDFKPERFIDTDTYKWPRHAFLTFSAGPRGCIGSRFSLTESVCILATLVRRYEVLLPDHVAKMERSQQIRYMTRWTHGVTMTPVHGQVKLRKRAF